MTNLISVINSLSSSGLLDIFIELVENNVIPTEASDLLTPGTVTEVSTLYVLFDILNMFRWDDKTETRGRFIVTDCFFISDNYSLLLCFSSLFFPSYSIPEQTLNDSSFHRAQHLTICLKRTRFNQYC